MFFPVQIKLLSDTNNKKQKALAKFMFLSPFVLQPPRLAATPPIFYVRKTHGEKRSPSAWLPSRGKNSCEART